MKLPTLFCRTNTKAIQQWTIEFEKCSYRTIFGQVDGKIQTTNWTKCKETNTGRSNQRNAEQQAEFEANAIWKKKRESGYNEDINLVDQRIFIAPMLAKNYEDYKEDFIFPVFSQPKLDGIRCLVSRKGMATRNGKKIYSCSHIFNRLQNFFETYPDLIFDGELYNHDLKHDFNKIASVVKKTKPTLEDLNESEALVEYWVYDIVDNNKTFQQRLTWIETNLSTKYDTPIKIVPTRLSSNQEQVNELYEAYTEGGFEGQMIRLNAKYENKRSKTLLKRKNFQDREYTILEITEGEGNKSGMAGAMVFKNERGIVFNSNIKGSREYLKSLWIEKKSLIGKQATVKFFNLTPDNNVPRFPYVISIRDYE